MYFGTKSYLKSNRNHIAKHALSFELKGLKSRVFIFIIFMYGIFELFRLNPSWIV